MNTTPLGQILFWMSEAHQNILKLVEELLGALRDDEVRAWTVPVECFRTADRCCPWAAEVIAIDE